MVIAQTNAISSKLMPPWNVGIARCEGLTEEHQMMRYTLQVTQVGQHVERVPLVIVKARRAYLRLSKLFH